ncbi:hypothetical protein EX30DRAFT_360455 [Ascodesmis nigricans]|uniref:Gfo/Idh/MocA-like oxidoreductase N-terminal domain-containing protein n=1 Tax=Ascodesmis nigricans TaxID=341454 RepID=A0A4S2MHU4_9PEZI|nr:hypothetical protein EX30DRAFT_360455 [Ascodesmis nigricans]
MMEFGCVFWKVLFRDVRGYGALLMLLLRFVVGGNRGGMYFEIGARLSTLPRLLTSHEGEYTTGWTGMGGSTSDKKVGVVALTLFDLRSRGKVGSLSMAGTNGTKFPQIRSHLLQNITQVYNNLSTTFTSFPSDAIARDPEAYKTAIEALSPGDAVTIFTPDSTHFPIALYAIERGLHVLLTKPAVKTLAEHYALLTAAKKHKVFVYIEHHKRFDPAYADARHRAKHIGEFGYFNAYMSQPKSQLETFKAWAGMESDISYYLNSHHIDVHASMVLPLGWIPVSVTASAATGTAEELGCVPGTEDTITLLVSWQKETPSSESPSSDKSPPTPRTATAVYTASWTAPQNSGVWSHQYFHYLASRGEIRIDQAKRGYESTTDATGIAWVNPFYMRYAPDEETGGFAGQEGYGYKSIEKFVDVCGRVNGGESVEGWEGRGLPTLAETVVVTAILEAGRRSLDEGRTVGVRRVKGRWGLV